MAELDGLIPRQKLSTFCYKHLRLIASGATRVSRPKDSVMLGLFHELAEGGVCENRIPRTDRMGMLFCRNPKHLL